TSGSGGAAGTGGSAGTEAGAGTGGTGGTEGGSPTNWAQGTKGDPLSTTEDDRMWTPVFDGNNSFYVVGYQDVGGNGDKQIAIAKYSTAGQRDATFGIKYHNHSTFAGLPDNPSTPASDPVASVEQGRDAVIQNGKLVVLAAAEDPTDATNHVMVVLRFTATGTLDTTFGPANTGKVELDLGDTPNDAPWGLDIDAQGRLLVFTAGRTRRTTPVVGDAGAGDAGAGARLTDSDRYVIRLTEDGAYDTGFGPGHDGIFSVDLPSSGTNTLGLNDSQRHGFVLRSSNCDGADAGAGCPIISAGYTNVGGRNQVALIKLNGDGTADTSFSGDGIFRFGPPSGMAEAYGVAMQQNGSFVTIGYGQVDLETPGGNLDMVSFRVTPAGVLDTSWGAGGLVAYDVAEAEDRGRYVLALPDDRILLIGAGTATPSDKDAMLVLLSKDGQPASYFGPDGRQLYSYGAPNEEFYGAALSPDGKWVAAVGYAAAGGTLTNGNSTVLVLPVGE
ncbi:MAG TPA: hypothetical protein VK524_10050, partial [Polyangiaceae bacterium]|nr:hypothetical protein [Polyangiaceae bacterium]